MTEYIVKIGFWLHAYEVFTIKANSDDEAIKKAKTLACVAMMSTAYPEHIEIEPWREGIIGFIDRITSNGCEVVTENIEFDDDRIYPPICSLTATPSQSQPSPAIVSGFLFYGDRHVPV